MVKEGLIQHNENSANQNQQEDDILEDLIAFIDIASMDFLESCFLKFKYFV